MKPITLHPLSVLAGLALAGALVVLAGAAQAPSRVQSIPVHDVRLVGEIPAEWWTQIELVAVSGTPVQTYTVPQDRWFVVTSVEHPAIFADGQDMITRLLPLGMSGGYVANGTRVAFGPGTLLDCRQITGTFTCWGYLAPVN